MIPWLPSTKVREIRWNSSTGDQWFLPLTKGIRKRQTRLATKDVRSNLSTLTTVISMITRWARHKKLKTADPLMTKVLTKQKIAYQ